MQIILVDSRETHCQERQLTLPANSVIADVLMRENIALDPLLLLGIWGKKASFETRLKPQDRLEIYAPLVCDPNLARQRRAINKRKNQNPDVIG